MGNECERVSHADYRGHVCSLGTRGCPKIHYDTTATCPSVNPSGRAIDYVQDGKRWRRHADGSITGPYPLGY